MLIPKEYPKFSFGIICKNAITKQDKYPIHFTGLLSFLNAFKYSCIAIIATIAKTISITYILPYIYEQLKSSLFMGKTFPIIYAKIA